MLMNGRSNSSRMSTKEAYFNKLGALEKQYKGKGTQVFWHLFRDYVKDTRRNYPNAEEDSA